MTRPIRVLLAAAICCGVVVTLTKTGRSTVGRPAAIATSPTSSRSLSSHGAPVPAVVTAPNGAPTSNRVYYARPRDCTFTCRPTIAEAEADCGGTVLDCFSCDATTLSARQAASAKGVSTTGRVASSSRSALMSLLTARSSGGTLSGYRCLEIPDYDGPAGPPSPSPVAALKPLKPPTNCDYFLNVGEFRMTFLHTSRCLCPGDVLNGYPLFTARVLATCVTKGLGPLGKMRDICESGHVLSTYDFRPVMEEVCAACGGVFGKNDYDFGQCLAK